MKVRTRIVCTLGPASESDDVIRSLIRAGMDVARLNFSHGSADEHAETARQAQQAWAAFWEIGCSLAKLNRDQLRMQWQQEKRSRTPVERRSNSDD